MAQRTLEIEATWVSSARLERQKITIDLMQVSAVKLADKVLPEERQALAADPKAALPDRTDILLSPFTFFITVNMPPAQFMPLWQAALGG